jgi:hypothetical protein
MSSPLGNVTGGFSPAPQDPRSLSANSTPLNRKLLDRQNADTAGNNDGCPGAQTESNNNKNGDAASADSPPLRNLRRSAQQQSTTPLPRSAASDPGVSQRATNAADELAGKRPESLRKRKSEPALPQMSLAVDGKIRKKLTDSLTKKQADEKKAGNNYIFLAVFEQGKELLKIGRTEYCVFTRVTAIQKTCGPVKIKPLYDLDLVPMKLYERVEHLIHAELMHFRYNFTCECKTAHREYFDVSVERVRRSSDRWKSFCRRKPYDEGGRLKKFWLQRLLQKPPKDPTTECDLRLDDEWIERHWEWYVNPTEVEIVRYHSAIIADHIKAAVQCVLRYRWQVIAMGNGFLLAVAISPSRKALVWFAMVTFLAFFESHAKLPVETTVKTEKGRRTSGGIPQRPKKCVPDEKGGNDMESKSQGATDDRQTSLGADENAKMSDAEMPDAETESRGTAAETRRQDKQDKPMMANEQPTRNEEVEDVGCGIPEDGKAAAPAYEAPSIAQDQTPAVG